MPVPKSGFCPRIILLLGLLQLSISQCRAAFVMNFTEVSYDMRRNGLALYDIQFRFIALMFPPKVT